jgi:hypothetical protein
MILESRYGSDGVWDLDLFIAKAQVSLVSVDGEQADLARRRFSSRETTSVKLTSSVILPAANDRRRAKAHKRARCLVKERAAKRLSGHDRPPARGRVKHHANVHCAE